MSEEFKNNKNNTFRLNEDEIKALGLKKKEGFPRNNRYYLNQNKRSILKEIRNSEKDEKIKKTVEENENERRYVYEGTLSIQDLETAIEFFNIDLNIWEVDKWVANSWDVSMKSGTKTNYQVKVFLKRKTQEIKSFVEMIKEEMNSYKIPEFVIKKKNSLSKDENKLGVINLFDAHIDKFCIIGQGSLSKNIEVFENAFNLLLEKAIREGCSKILFPVGSDFWNSNALSETTKNGTPQVNVRIAEKDPFGVGTKAIRRCIDKASIYCEVIVLVLKGNHDEDTCKFAGELLSQIYENQERVTVENTTRQRKYFEWGKCLLGFAHGDKEKKKISELPLLMAEEQREAWGRTKFREFYLGDLHHKQEFKFLKTKDFIGCTVRFLRSVSVSLDQWHDDFGWIGVPKTAELFVWDKEDGLCDNDLKNIK